MVHEMKLNEKPFRMIAEGLKTIELRLFDEKRQKLQPGDRILFQKRESSETITARVKALHRFADFKELYETLPLSQCGYADSEVADYRDMYEYYSEDRIRKYGVVGIELECIVPFLQENEE